MLIFKNKYLFFIPSDYVELAADEKSDAKFFPSLPRLPLPMQIEMPLPLTPSTSGSTSSVATGFEVGCLVRCSMVVDYLRQRQPLRLCAARPIPNNITSSSSIPNFESLPKRRGVITRLTFRIRNNAGNTKQNCKF